MWTSVSLETAVATASANVSTRRVDPVARIVLPVGATTATKAAKVWMRMGALAKVPLRVTVVAMIKSCVILEVTLIFEYEGDTIF